MNEIKRAEIKQLAAELDRSRSLLKKTKLWLEDDPVIDKHLSFWLESAQFLITELEIWEDLKNETKYEETLIRVRNVLSYIHQVLTQFGEKDHNHHDVGGDVK